MRILGKDNGLLVIQMADHSQVKMTEAEYASMQTGDAPEVERKDVAAPVSKARKAKK